MTVQLSRYEHGQRTPEALVGLGTGQGGAATSPEAASTAPVGAAGAGRGGDVMSSSAAAALVHGCINILGDTRESGTQNLMEPNPATRAEQLFVCPEIDCEDPGVLLKRVWRDDGPVRISPKRCRRCAKCHRAQWAVYYRRVETRMDGLVDALVHAKNLELTQEFHDKRARNVWRMANGLPADGPVKLRLLGREEYLWRHGRHLTFTVRSPEWMDQRERYSVALFARQVTRLLQELKKRLRARGLRWIPYVLQLEPHTESDHADYRLHGHMVVLGIPDDFMVWDGPDSKRRLDGPISGTEWFRAMEADARSETSFGRWMLGTGYWGTSSCDRLDGSKSLVEYVTSELTTSSSFVGDFGKFLDYAYRSEATSTADDATPRERRGQMVRRFRYSQDFNGVFEGALDEATRFLNRVPVHERVAALSVEEFKRRLEAWQRDGMEFQVSAEGLTREERERLEIVRYRADVAMVSSMRPAEIRACREAQLQLARLRERFRRGRDRWLWRWSHCYRSQLNGVLDMMPAELVQLRRAALDAAEAARAARQGIPAWMVYRPKVLDMCEAKAREAGL